MLRDDLLLQFARIRDAVVGDWVTAALAGTEPPCGSCHDGWCCRQLPLAHLLEGAVIARALTTAKPKTPPGLDGKIHAQSTAQLALVATAQSESKRLLQRGRHAEAGAAAAYGATWSEPCAFYDAVKGCLIYDGRPAACRTFFAASTCTAKPTTQLLDASAPLAAVYELADAAYSAMLGLSTPQRFVPVPLAYAVSVGLLVEEKHERFAQNLTELPALRSRVLALALQKPAK